MPQQPLPIDDYIASILTSLAASPTLALVAPPGAGKTTRLPPALLGEPWLAGGRVLVSQPRRVAARAAAKRVAEECGWALGAEVGFAVRGESRYCAATRLLFCTEGVLSNLLQSDPFLEGVGCVIFDEFHERNLDGDLALAFVREIRASARPDLRVVVCSATLDPGPVAAYLSAATVEVPGRVYPVAVTYLDKQPEGRLDQTVFDGVRMIWPQRPGNAGDALVFLPGAGEIRRAAEKLEPWAKTRGAEVVVLHGDLPAEAQDKALAPHASPRVILSTNVAETSVTIEGVSAVVDSGLVKLAAFDPAAGLSSLTLTRASKASATQRAGRAGRTGPGVCLRLWTLHDELSTPERIPPEVKRADLTRSVLEIAAWGHPDPAAFPWFEAPEAERLAEASALLRELGATAGGGTITPLGRELLALPVHPRLARMLLKGAQVGFPREAAALCAVLEERDLSLAGRAFGSAAAQKHPSDALYRVDLLDEAESLRFSPSACRERSIDAGAARSAARERDRLAKLVRGRQDATGDAETPLLRLLFDAYPDRAAKLDAQSGRYLLASGRGAALSDASSVRGEEYVVALRLQGGRRGERSEEKIHWASKVEREWLATSPLAREEVEARFDAKTGRVSGVKALKYGAITLKASPFKPDPAELSTLLFEALKTDPLAALKPNERALALVGRVNFLNRHLGAEGICPWGAEEWRGLLEELCVGRGTLKELREADHEAAIMRRLPREARDLLRKEAPERVAVPSGREHVVRYPDDAPPYVEVKLQEVFGLAKTPLLACGRVPLVMRLVSPSAKPLQVTSDLASFWKNAYSEVKKEMRGRYPKHYWPDDPMQATPTARTVKPRIR